MSANNCGRPLLIGVRVLQTRFRLVVAILSVGLVALAIAGASFFWKSGKEQTPALAPATDQMTNNREAEMRTAILFIEHRIFAAARPKGEENGLGSDVTLHQAIEAAVPFAAKDCANAPLA